MIGHQSAEWPESQEGTLYAKGIPGPAAAEVLSDQGVDENLGLSNGEASARLAKTGPNKLEEAEKTPLWKRFFEQMADPMVIMLIVAAVISALTGMVKGEADFADVAIIMFVVIVNSVLGVVQEAKSEEALEALQEMSAAQSKVLRDGKLVHLPSAELVPGDVLMLEAGDSVPADCRVLESATMKIEEAALTGESVPVEKHANVIELAAGTRRRAARRPQEHVLHGLHRGATAAVAPSWSVPA